MPPADPSPQSVAAPSSAVRAFARQSTSLKVLILLTLALLPLGVIASLASLETARTNRANRVAAGRLLADESADRLNLFLDRTAIALRSAQHQGRSGCRHVADAIGDPGVAVALFAPNGRLTCSSRAFTATLPLQPAPAAPIAMIDQEDAAVRLVVSATPANGPGAGWALAELPRAALAKASHPHALDGSYALRLSDHRGHALDIARLQATPLSRESLAVLPIAGGQLSLDVTVSTPALSANEILLTVLPMLMWVAAAATGWLVVDRLILKPLGKMQAAIDRYGAQGTPFELLAPTTPAHEILALGSAFARATATITRHEHELEEGLARQTRLTREVHHRVKNNLQVVASLLNLHARGARSPEAADAYATIQRRVDALALVHRSHYAELEVNHGIALRPLISELASNLRGSLPPGVTPPMISHHLHLLHANQDVAVSVAFLIVELVETAMLRVPGAPIALRLEAVPDRPDRAKLSITSPALRRDAAEVDDRYVRFERVVGGLSRQLRAPLDRDDETGCATIEISVMPPA